MKAFAPPDAGADDPPASIALIGMPGAGKSTVGPALARRLERVWLDTDDEIERRLGGSIRAYFASHGEPAFRDLEQQVVAELAARRGCVLGTGGGSVLRGANRDALKSRSVAVYLHATPRVLIGRLRDDTVRPLLQGGDPLRRLEELFAQRDAFYRTTAHVVVETDRLDVAAAVEAIVRWLAPARSAVG